MRFSESRSSELGFGLVELIIAVFLLFVLAVALLPALIRPTNLSVANRSIVTATAVANAQLAPIRAAFPNDPPVPTSCAVLQLSQATNVTDVETGLQFSVTVDSCPATGYPRVVSVTVEVYKPGDAAKPMESLPTKVMVSGP